MHRWGTRDRKLERDEALVVWSAHPGELLVAGGRHHPLVGGVHSGWGECECFGKVVWQVWLYLLTSIATFWWRGWGGAVSGHHGADCHLPQVTFPGSCCHLQGGESPTPTFSKLTTPCTSLPSLLEKGSHPSCHFASIFQKSWWNT
jgi:hypothetical protein